MQKLTSFSVKQTARQRGSALVGAVAISCCMAIGAISYIQLMRSASNNESSFLAQTRAHYALESGLFRGTAYASTLVVTGNGDIETISSDVFSGITYNGIPVTVHVQNGATSQSVVVTATTDDPVSGTGKRMRMSWTATTSFNIYSQLYGDYNQDLKAFNPNEWGWYATNEFEGRFHINSKLHLKNWAWASNAFKFSGGLVSTADNTASSPGGAFLTPNKPNANGFYNNFSKGMEFDGSGTPSADNLNGYFQDQYQSGAQTVSLNATLAATIAGTTGAINLTGTTMPGAATGETYGDVNTNPGGTAAPNARWRPTLEFLPGGTVNYYYYDGANFVSTPYNYNGKILVCPTSVNVLGVLGQNMTATVVTAANRDISVVADGRNTARNGGAATLPGLVYQDAAKSADGLHLQVPDGSTSALALVSGRYIRFQESWRKRWGATGTTIQIRDSLNAQVSGWDGFLNVTGALVGTAHDSACAKYNNWAYGGTLGNDNANNRYYALRVFGSSAFTTYGPHCYYKNSGTMFRNNKYFYDPRLVDQVQYPGQRPVVAAAGGMIFTFSNWQVSYL